MWINIWKDSQSHLKSEKFTLRWKSNPFALTRLAKSTFARPVTSEDRNSIQCCEEYNLIQPLWKTLAKISKTIKLYMCIPYKWEIPILDTVYPLLKISYLYTRRYVVKKSTVASFRVTKTGNNQLFSTRTDK